MHDIKLIRDNPENFSKKLSYRNVKLDIKDWTLIYGNLSHDNPILGNPSSIEIKKYF